MNDNENTIFENSKEKLDKITECFTELNKEGDDNFLLGIIQMEDIIAIQHELIIDLLSAVSDLQQEMHELKK